SQDGPQASSDVQAAYDAGMGSGFAKLPPQADRPTLFRLSEAFTPHVGLRDETGMKQLVQQCVAAAPEVTLEDIVDAIDEYGPRARAAARSSPFAYLRTMIV